MQCSKYDVCEPVVRQCHPERVISCPWIRKQQLLSKQSANLQFRNLWNCQNVFPRDNCSSAICWLWFPSSELPETKKSRSEADYGGGSAIKLWLLQRISSISSTRKKMDIIFFSSLYFTQWNTNLFVLPNSYSCNSGMFLSFRSNIDNLDIISRHKECFDSSNNHKKKRTIFTFENSFQFLWQKRRISNNFHSSKYCSSSAGLVRSNSRRSSSIFKMIFGSDR